MTRQKVTTIPQLADAMHTGFKEIRADVKEIRNDIASVENKVDVLQTQTSDLTDRVGKVEVRISDLLDYSTLKTEHDRMKQIIRTKLGMEV